MTHSRTTARFAICCILIAKAASIWSHLDDGLLERTVDHGGCHARSFGGGEARSPGVADARLGTDYADKRSVLQSRTLHHDLLNRVWRRLAKIGLVTDLAASLAASEDSSEAIRLLIEKRPYLKAAGQSVIEDYRRMLCTTSFNDIVALAARSAHESVKKSDEK